MNKNTILVWINDYCRLYFLYILLPVAVFSFGFSGYYYITQPELFMFSYCSPGVYDCEGGEGYGLLSGKFNIPMVSYEEGLAREAQHKQYSNKIIFGLLIIYLGFIYDYRHKYSEVLKKWNQELKK
jgi:hypothetical protein